MAEQAFKPGDVVILKSGGPRMTVTQIGEGAAKLVWCVWFDGTKKIEGDFPPAALKIAGTQT